MRGVSSRIVATAVRSCRIQWSNEQQHHQQFCLRHFAGKKRKNTRGRQHRRGAFRTDWEPLEEMDLKMSAKQHQSDGPITTAFQEMGWKPIVFILLAPIGAWGIWFATAGPDLQQKMLRDLGFVAEKNETKADARLPIEASAPKAETDA